MTPPPRKPTPDIIDSQLEGRLELFSSFRSAHLGRHRNIWVYLPKGYELESRSLPVFYFQDGQNLFEASKSATGIHWRLGETIDAGVREGSFQPFIAVGIANSGKHRIDEYAPTRVRERDAGGGAALYMKMLVDEIKPLIDDSYYTDPSPESTGIGGSSMGALVALYGAFQYPETFGMVSAMSPSLWWDRSYIIKMIRRSGFHDTRIWLDSGGREARGQLPDVRRLKRLLCSLGWTEGEDLFYSEEPDGDHSETAWASRLPSALESLLRRRRSRTGVASPSDLTRQSLVW